MDAKYIKFSTSTGGGSSSPLLTGLVSYWKLDESSGTLADSKDSNNSSSASVTYSATGKINTGISFNGSSNYVDFGNSSNLQLSTTGGISMWVYLNTTDAQAILSKEDLGSDLNGYSIYTASGNLYAEIANASTYVVTSTSVSTSTWYHVVFTWNTSATYLYLNGSQVDTDGTLTAISTAYNLYLGREGASANYYFNGTIDEVGIWNRLITSSEVTSLYNSGNGYAYPFN